MRPTLMLMSLLAGAGAPAAVLAQDRSDVYLKAYGGVSALQSDRLELDGASSSASFDTGFTVGGALGYDFGDRPFRAEIEYAYRTGDVSDLSASVGTGGDFASTTVMLNGYYTFDAGVALRPYAGIGLGYVTEIDFDIDKGPGAGEYSDRGLFAFQAMVGADFPVSDRFSIFGEARYFSAGSADLDGPRGTRLTADYDTLDFIAGVVVDF